MENIIYNEMRYRRFLVDVGNVNIRVKNEKGELQRVTLEVDFVCNLGSRKYYLQSAYKLPDEEKMKQEKRSPLPLALARTIFVTSKFWSRKCKNLFSLLRRDKIRALAQIFSQ